MPKIVPTHMLPRTRDIKDADVKRYAEQMNRFLDELTRKVSLADDISQVKKVEIAVGTNTGGSDGNWLFTSTGTSLVIQNRQSGSWVSEFLLEPSA